MSEQTEKSVGGIFRRYGDAYRSAHRLPPGHLKVMRAVERCRTAALGGHVEQCPECGFRRVMYNSCRNRHCPTCQTGARERWLYERKQEVLPVVYYHIVFTVPCELNDLMLRNKRVCYDLLFRAAAETLLELCRDPKHMGGRPGILAILHTWGQTLTDHPHLHCLVTGGGISNDGERWVSPRRTNEKRSFFIHVNVISALFKGKFTAFLDEACKEGKLNFCGRIDRLQKEGAFTAFKKSLYAKEWVTYCRDVYRRPEQVIDYLGRYTHRVAVSNHRIVSVDDGAPAFSYRDYQDKERRKQMTLSAEEFIRRFLLHVLPHGYYRIRYYGLFSNRNRKKNLDWCRRLLKAVRREEKPFDLLDAVFELTGIDLSRCPHCQIGAMCIVKTLEPVYQPP
jgi:hypothetical protein